MSIRYKIAILFAVLSSLILTAVALAVYFFSVKERTDFFRLRLKNRALSTAQIVATVVDSNYSIIGKLDAASVASFYNKSVTILNYRNQVLYQYADQPGNEISLTSEQIEDIKISNEYYFQSNNRTVVGIQYLNEDHNFITVIAAADVDGEQYLEDLQRLLLFASLFSTILSFLVGLLFARTLVRPIRHIIAEVNLISSHNLSKKIDEGKTNDELHRLSKTFNDLLGRLQESFIIQRRFISNASHELSTPLTSVSSQVEVALQKERSNEEYKEVLRSIHEDVKGLHLLTKSLLDIAKTGTEGSIELHHVRLDEVLLRAAADVQKLNSNYHVSINFETMPEDEQELTVFGNSNLLYIAFKNIIENGCKYASDNSCTITTVFSSLHIKVHIQSMGQIIKPNELPHIFLPFFRAGNVEEKEGFGLGLTLVKRILSLHKAIITASSSTEKGTIFTVEIPSRNNIQDLMRF
ncbi:MAG: HAMP domain-containing protein [Chitinophagaceae bacterium]|jgi:two-component system, OmpR family, sensor histidine kinase ArlS|nr:HAMP domain-containing protein [Chitinophagaceae bacterium]